MTNIRTFIFALFAALFLAVTPIDDAFGRTLQEAAERVARQYDAKVISAREVERDGRRIYIIRILTEDGVVRTIRVPARD